MKHILLLSPFAALILAGCGGPTSQVEKDGEDIAAVETTTEAEVANIESEIEAVPVEATLPGIMADLITADYAEFETVRYEAGNIDLNADGVDEWLVYVMGPGICGSGGCPLKVLGQNDDGVFTIATLSVTQMPVGVFDSQTEGWRDLAVTVGGGGMEYGVARVPYSDDSYASNPTVAPAELTEESFTTVIALPSFE